VIDVFEENFSRSLEAPLRYQAFFKLVDYWAPVHRLIELNLEAIFRVNSRRRVETGSSDRV